MKKLYTDVRLDSKYVSGIFRHIQSLGNPGIFNTLVFLDPSTIRSKDVLRTRCILRTMVHPAPWFIQNPGIFRTRGIFRNLVH